MNLNLIKLKQNITVQATNAEEKIQQQTNTLTEKINNKKRRRDKLVEQLAVKLHMTSSKGYTVALYDKNRIGDIEPAANSGTKRH